MIEGLERAAKLPGKVFHAGTQLQDGKVVTNGGRVLCATALGATVAEAQRDAYALARCGAVARGAVSAGYRLSGDREGVMLRCHRAQLILRWH